MNYIQRLQAENKTLRESLLAIEAYVTSDKFAFPNDYVSTHDITLRIREAFEKLAEFQY